MSSRGKSVTKRIIEQRQREAKIRQDEYDALTLQQKLDKLPAPPASARQRTKLESQMRKPAKVEVVLSPEVEPEVNSTSEEPKKLRAKDRRANDKK